MCRRTAAWLVLVRRRYWQRSKGYDRLAGLGLRPSRPADPQWRQRLQRLVQGRQSLPRVRQRPRASSSTETQVARLPVVLESLSERSVLEPFIM